MTAFPSLSLSLLLAGRRRPQPQPKRKRWRPRKPSAPISLLDATPADAPDQRQKFTPEAVLRALERELLDPEILEAAIARAAARMASASEDDPHARRRSLEAALVQAETALVRLTEAVSQGGAVATLVQAIRDQSGGSRRGAQSWRVSIGRVSCR